MNYERTKDKARKLGVITTANNQNLRPLNTLPPEERREIARKGGIASGERRRYMADLRLVAIETLAEYDLVQETRKEYKAAIKRYVQEERRKAKRNRKKKYP